MYICVCVSERLYARKITKDKEQKKTPTESRFKRINNQKQQQ